MFINAPIIDYWKDGKIDCKDYAIRNSIIISRIGGIPTWYVSKNHVFVIYKKGDIIYIFNNDQMYISSVTELKKEGFHD